MYPQTESHFFSLPIKIRIIIQREYLKQHPEIKATGHLLPPVEGRWIKWWKGVSIAHPLMLTCIKIYKEICPMAFEDLIIRFPPWVKQQLPLKMVLPPPRRCLRNLTLIVDAHYEEMREYQGLALHLLGSPSLEKFTIKGNHGSDWFDGYTAEHGAVTAALLVLDEGGI
ncbi:hypothetical protein NCS52_00850000 [Fusarium sp. LHS14.1]|nr:hypothetical protein NCS52_00850000 [Fusarium sp. LHS14.1]